MTKEEKKDRRKARHQVEGKFKRVVRRRLGFYSTAPQIASGLKVFIDGYMKNMRQMTKTAKILENA
jgi:hypothetical protein